MYEIITEELLIRIDGMLRQREKDQTLETGTYYGVEGKCCTLGAVRELLWGRPANESCCELHDGHVSIGKTVTLNDREDYQGAREELLRALGLQMGALIPRMNRQQEEGGHPDGS